MTSDTVRAVALQIAAERGLGPSAAREVAYQAVSLFIAMHPKGEVMPDPGTALLTRDDVLVAARGALKDRVALMVGVILRDLTDDPTADLEDSLARMRVGLRIVKRVGAAVRGLIDEEFPEDAKGVKPSALILAARQNHRVFSGESLAPRTHDLSKTL